MIPYTCYRVYWFKQSYLSADVWCWSFPSIVATIYFAQHFKTFMILMKESFTVMIVFGNRKRSLICGCLRKNISWAKALGTFISVIVIQSLPFTSVPYRSSYKRKKITIIYIVFETTFVILLLITGDHCKRWLLYCTGKNI